MSPHPRFRRTRALPFSVLLCLAPLFAVADDEAAPAQRPAQPAPAADQDKQPSGEKPSKKGQDKDESREKPAGPAAGPARGARTRDGFEKGFGAELGREPRPG